MRVRELPKEDCDRCVRFALFSHPLTPFPCPLFLSLSFHSSPSLLTIAHVDVLRPSRMTSHAPPRLSSHSSNQPWRKVDEKPTYLSSLSSTLKMGSTRSWLASTPRDTIPMHHHQKSNNNTLEWRDSPQHRGLLANLRRAIRNALRFSDTLPSFTSMSRRAGGLSVGRPTFASITSPHLFSIPSLPTLRFVFLCGLWYASSALSSNTGKAILNQFRYPVTLTFVQFGFVAAYCLLLMSPIIRFSRMRRPTRAILRDTLPMGCFQVGGHIFSSMAISRIPVSTTHTIKVSAHQRLPPSDTRK